LQTEEFYFKFLFTHLQNSSGMMHFEQSWATATLKVAKLQVTNY